MPDDPWLAIDATTSLTARARELRRAWDDFVGNGHFDAVRGPIAESWQRSRAAGIDPASGGAPTLLEDRRDVAERWETHPLEAAAPLVRRWLGGIADDSEQLIVVSDADGLLLWVEGSARVRSAAADSINFVEGTLWSEGGAGTNAIGTALAADHPVQVHAAEHFNQVVHARTCSAAPVHDPDGGGLLGVVDLTGPMRVAHPLSLAVLLAAERAIEADLRDGLEERDARLRDRYFAALASKREPLALVSRSGRVIADHPDGFLRVERINVPSLGGELVLPSGVNAIADPVGDAEAFVVRAVPTARSSPRQHVHRRTRVPGVRMLESVSRRRSQRRRSQQELTRLAEEHAALRRVAMLVAGQAAADEIFAAVAAEVAQLLGADRVAVCRYESDDFMTVMAYWSGSGRDLPVGTRVGLQGDSVAATVRQSCGPARLDGYAGLSGPVIDLTSTLGAAPHSTVGAPIVVASCVWGVVIASSTTSPTFPDDTESRIMSFAELAATAISNAISRDELAASRARIVVAADEARRRIQRDLHDGAQQRLVALALALRATEAKLPPEFDELRDELSRTASGLAEAVEDLHEISRGIHPTLMANGGLGAALRTLCRRVPLSVELDVRTDQRLPESVEVAAYYVVSEALTNIVKHAGASLVSVVVDVSGGVIDIAIRDDGVGGADPGRGSGLIGLRDRVEAIAGTLVLESPIGAGTPLSVMLPSEPRAQRDGASSPEAEG